MKNNGPIGTVKRMFTFPHPVNEVAARWVAGMVAAFTLVIMITQVYWLLLLLVYGFAARVLAGPRLSVMGLVATKILVPLFGNRKKITAGPPKQFAQLIGLIFSVTALVLVYGFSMTFAATVVLGILASFAILESLLGFCAGCLAFGYLMKWGLIPKETCERCSDIRVNG